MASAADRARGRCRGDGRCGGKPRIRLEPTSRLDPRAACDRRGTDSKSPAALCRASRLWRARTTPEVPRHRWLARRDGERPGSRARAEGAVFVDC